MEALNNVANLLKEFVRWFQFLAPFGCAVTFGIGGFQFFLGGKDGAQKAKPYLLGGACGLIIILMSNSFSSFLSSKITF